MIRFPHLSIVPWLAYSAALLLGISTSPVTAEAQQAPATTARFGWVNSQLIIRQVPGYAAAESTLNSEIAGFRAEVQRLQTQLDSTMRAYEREQIGLSPTNREAKQQQIREMQQRLQQRYDELQDQAAQRERELVSPLEERVKGVIEGVRAERNLLFIFDVGAPGNNVIAADRSLDLTAVVVQRLQGADK
jgi:outer membrane protein